jgi:hypothetical protein
MGREVLGREKTFPSTEWKFKVIDEYIDTDSSHTRIYIYTSDSLDNLMQQAQHQRMMLISDAAEMDKSTVLTHMSKQIKQNFQTK